MLPILSMNPFIRNSSIEKKERGNRKASSLLFSSARDGGVWERILSAMIEQDLVDETTLMPDSTTVKVHRHASGAKPRRNRTEQGRFDNESPCGNGLARESIAFFALQRESQ